MRRPVRIMSRALLGPISAGSLWVPPAPGMMASLVSGRPTVADDANTRKVVHSPSSSPPPRAVEAIAEMVGMGKLASSVNVDRRSLRNCFVLFS